MKKFMMLTAGVLAICLTPAQLARADDAETIKNAEIGGSRCRRRRCRDLCPASRRFHENIAGRNQWFLVHAK